MNTYKWSGRTNQGATEQGTESAPTADHLATVLMRRGVTPLTIEVAHPQENWASLLRTLLPYKPTATAELTLLCRQMATITRSGVPILSGVRTIAPGINDPGLRSALFAVADAMEGGESLANSLSRYPEHFSELFVILVRVGETGGQLESSFRELERNLKRELSTTKKVKSAVRYPLFVVIAMLVAIMVINMLVIPAFSGLFDRESADLPLLTQILVLVSDLTVNYWPVWIALIVANVIGLRMFVATPRGALLWGEWKLKLPIVGPLFMSASIERYTRSFALLLRSGVPLTELVSLCAIATDNPYLQARIEGIRSSLERGDSFVISHQRVGLFPPLVVQMLSVGEESGQLDDLLGEVSLHYQEELDYELERLSARIEPILIVCLSAMVAVLALGIFMPIWDLYAMQLTGR